jgi:hypothetical protein
MAVDYNKHDARLNVVVGVSRTKRPWSWHCIRCDAHGNKYATSQVAKRSAERHNGGPYNG